MNFESFMKKLPKEIGNEIFSFIIPSSSNIEFRSYRKYFNGQNSYSEKYETAFIGDKIVENSNGLYLTRIFKKNGKHRYYISNLDIDVLHIERDDRYYPIYYYDYSSKYVGKDIDKALLFLL